MEDVKLTLGTIENLVLDVKDRLGTLTTLDGHNVTFDWREKNATDWEGQGVGATNVGMRVFCLINTSAWAVSKIGRYELYLRFQNLPETPRLGPFEFRVDQ